MTIEIIFFLNFGTAMVINDFRSKPGRKRPVQEAQGIKSRLHPKGNNKV